MVAVAAAALELRRAVLRREMADMQSLGDLS